MQEEDLDRKKMTSLHEREWLNFFNWSDRLRCKPSKCPEVGSIAVMAFFDKLLREFTYVLPDSVSRKKLHRHINKYISRGFSLKGFV